MIRRLECPDHLTRMENSRIPKAALDAKLEGKRRTTKVKMARRYTDVS
jgi:hypothetical protein